MSKLKTRNIPTAQNDLEYIYFPGSTRVKFFGRCGRIPYKIDNVFF